MKSYIALFACLAFCVWVLRKLEDFEGPDSMDLWIPSLWLFRCASRSIDYWLSGSPIALVTGSLQSDGSNSFTWTDPLLLITLMILGARILHKRNVSWPVFVQNNRWLVLFFVYMALSCAWSPTPFVSVKRYVRAVGDLMMAIITMTSGRPIEALFTIVRRTAVFYVPLSIVVCKYFPKYGRTQSKSWAVPDSWVGLSTHKNALTAMLMVIVVFFAWDIFRARNKGIQLPKLPGPRWLTLQVVYVSMCLYLMFSPLCRSSTALTATVVGFLVMYLIKRSEGDTRRLVVSVCAIFGGYFALEGAAFVVAQKSLPDLILAVMGKNPTLTGRTEFWPILIHMGLDQPLLGSGYGGFWTAKLMDYFLGISKWGFIPESHNGYIETFVTLGFVGLGFLLMVIFGSIRYSLRLLTVSPKSGCIRLVLMAMILVHNFAEASFVRDNHTLWVLFLIVSTIPVIPESSEETVPIYDAEVVEEDADKAELQPFPVNR